MNGNSNMVADRLGVAMQIQRNSPTLGEAEAAAAAGAILSGWVARGTQTAEFENELCELHGLDAGHAVAVSSGTAALFLALRLLQAEGKRVALPAYAGQSMLHAVRAARGEPLTVDSESTNNPNVDFRALRARLPDIAIVPHMFGIPQEITSESFPVIEDCAQALGASFSGRPVGLMGTLAIFSFGATKMITAGGAGGAVLSRDRSAIDQIRDYLAYADRDDNVARFNFEITDVAAAVGRVQLRRLGEFRDKRETLFQIYRRAGIPLVDSRDPRSRPVRFWAAMLSSAVAELAEHLRKNGIPAAVPVAPNRLLGPGAPNASVLAQTALLLPLYPLLPESACAFVAETVQRFAG
jgi:perosamine synthetase